jgi:hypothetical protein
MGACGASREEVATVMRALETADKADQATTRARDNTPEWKQECINNYNDCINQFWVGSCHDCLRFCEGQRKWPDDRCYLPKRKK